MRKKLLLSVVVMLSVTIAGCSSNSTTSKPIPDTNATESAQSQNQDSSTDKNSEKEVKEDKEVIPSTENKSSENKDTVTKVTLSIYNEDPNTMEIQQKSTVEVNENDNLKTKLSTLASSLSKSNFDSLPIEIKSIDTVDGKKIATINLSETDSNKGITNPSELKSPNWRSYFQGSAGGQITADSLLETFLQVKYTGQWVDGVKFLYNDENIEFEHVSNLSEIQYRN